MLYLVLLWRERERNNGVYLKFCSFIFTAAALLLWAVDGCKNSSNRAQFREEVHGLRKLQGKFYVLWFRVSKSWAICWTCNFLGWVVIFVSSRFFSVQSVRFMHCIILCIMFRVLVMGNQFTKTVLRLIMGFWYI